MGLMSTLMAMEDQKTQKLMREREMKFKEKYSGPLMEAQSKYYYALIDQLMNTELKDKKRQAEALKVTGMEQEIKFAGHRLEELERMMRSKDEVEVQKARDIFIGYKSSQDTNTMFNMLRLQNDQMRTAISFQDYMLKETEAERGKLADIIKIASENPKLTDRVFGPDEMEKFKAEKYGELLGIKPQERKEEGRGLLGWLRGRKKEEAEEIAPTSRTPLNLPSRSESGRGGRVGTDEAKTGLAIKTELEKNLSVDPTKSEMLAQSGIEDVPDSVWNTLGSEKTAEVMEELAAGGKIVKKGGNWVLQRRK